MTTKIKSLGLQYVVNLDVFRIVFQIVGNVDSDQGIG